MQCHFWKYWPHFHLNLMLTSFSSFDELIIARLWQEFPPWLTTWLFCDRRIGVLWQWSLILLFLIQKPHICEMEGKKRNKHRLCVFHKSAKSAETQSRWWKLKKKKFSQLNSMQIKHCKAKLFCIMFMLCDCTVQDIRI